MFSLDRAVFGKKQALIVFIAGAIIGIGLNLAFGLLGITQSSEAFAQAADRQFSRSFLEGMVLYGVLAPILEEVIFRLGIFRLLRKMLPFFGAMTLSAALFGLYHGNAVQGTYGFLVGLALAFLMEKYRTVYGPILFHAGANIGVWVLLYG